MTLADRSFHEERAFDDLVPQTHPATLPPGRARWATSPLPTGSPAADMTIGMVEVALGHEWVRFHLPR